MASFSPLFEVDYFTPIDIRPLLPHDFRLGHTQHELGAGVVYSAGKWRVQVVSAFSTARCYGIVFAII
jgi:hypothetical protein